MLILGAVLIVPILTGPAVSVFGFLERYGGVVVLVGLSCAVMFGVACCTDRLILSIRFRVMFQNIHRAMAVIGVGFLPVHIVSKIMAGKAASLEAFVPFARSVPVGLGTIAAYLTVMITVVGLLRLRFMPKPWMWRLLHCVAYAGWPIAVIHGLTAGRPAATWVRLSYLACMVAVGLGLLVRILFSGGRTRTRGRIVTAPQSTPSRRRVATSPRPGARVGADGGGDAEFWASLRKEVRRPDPFAESLAPPGRRVTGRRAAGLN